MCFLSCPQPVVAKVAPTNSTKLMRTGICHTREVIPPLPRKLMTQTQTEIFIKPHSQFAFSEQSTTDLGGLNYTAEAASPLAADGLHPNWNTSDSLTTLHAKINNGLWSQLFSEESHSLPSKKPLDFFCRTRRKCRKCLISVQTFSSASNHQEV